MEEIVNQNKTNDLNSRHRSPHEFMFLIRKKTETFNWYFENVQSQHSEHSCYNMVITAKLLEISVSSFFFALESAADRAWSDLEGKNSGLGGRPETAQEKISRVLRSMYRAITIFSHTK